MIDEPSMDQAFLQKLKEIVEENLGNEQFGVKDLARAAGMSRSKIHRKLQKITSQSTSQFIREIRLDHAFEMLQNQVATVSEISYRVGFSSPTYFSKCFHEYYGFPPRDAVHKPADDNNEKTLASAGDTIIDGPKKTPFPIFYSISFIFVLLLLLSGYYYYQNWINPAHPERESIAVLPLHNFTGEDDQAFFVDGMHDALIGELGQLGNFRVISRTSTLRFRNTELSIKEIARILAVDNIVEGSVYRAEDSVRILIQLIAPEPEEQHLWAKNYDRNTEDILSLLSDVTRDIAQNVQVTLSPVEDSLLANRRQVNPEAYKAYLRGSYLLDQFTPESYEKGISYLLEATRIDPADPLPWARLALGYNTSGHGIIPAEDAYTRAQVAADRALKLDNTLGEVHLAQAVIALYSNWDWDAADKHFK